MQDKDTTGLRDVLAIQLAQAQAESEARAAAKVVHPNHYSRFVIEPVTFCVANKLNFNQSNVVKYTCRAGHKNGIEDLQKAIRYLEMEIETIRREERVAAGESPQDVWKVSL